MRTLRSMALAGILGASALTPAASDGADRKPTTETASEVVLVSEVEWNELNPARGDMSPKAGTLWGDRNGGGPTGFLLKPADGFESPPHIHNVSYRGVVISGLIHNDDADAAEMWMPAGSFWTQPKGEAHITSARGSNTMAYIEIEEGPYLVHPVEQAFPNDERPVNIDESNLVWLDASNISWIEQPGGSAPAGGAKVAFLWGEPKDGRLSGTLVKLPAGFAGKIHSYGSTFHAVVIQGQPLHRIPGETNLKSLGPGSYFSSKAKSVHEVSSDSKQESIIYVRTDSLFEVIPLRSKKEASRK